MDPDEVLAASLGPAQERLSRTYHSVDDYVDAFRLYPSPRTALERGRRSRVPATTHWRRPAVCGLVRSRSRCASTGAYDEQVDLLTAETVPDVNHHTILFDPASAARVATVNVGD
jgi:hypothetical protein